MAQLCRVCKTTKIRYYLIRKKWLSRIEWLSYDLPQIIGEKCMKTNCFPELFALIIASQGGNNP